jgi:DNA-binding NarL/FixJ family response regulator
MKILIVDDRALIRDSLRSVLKELMGETAVIIEAPDA